MLPLSWVHIRNRFWANAQSPICNTTLVKASMRKDSSYGVIPLSNVDGQWHVYIIRHNAGHWAFPKGHPEKGETPQQTAERELKEETGLNISRFFPNSPLQEHYSFIHDQEAIDKTVFYFLAEVHGDIKLQEEEVSNGEWIALKKVHERITFQESKELCSQVQKLFLKG